MSENLEVDQNKDSSGPDNAALGRRAKIIKEIKSIGLIIFLVLVFRSICFEPFKIPSGSMIPTLMIGDFILVNKMSYGFKVPFSDVFSDPIYIGASEDPKRGDVIVFKYPKKPNVNYIKRVIGVPGDTIQVKDKVVYVNDEPIKIQKIDNAKIMEDMDDKFKDNKLVVYKASLKNKDYIYQIDEDNYYNTDFDKIKVPKGHFFVMGDNRDHSYDSRFWGFVAHQNIKGKAILVWLSWILPWSEDDMKFRPWRIGTLIK